MSSRPVRVSCCASARARALGLEELAALERAARRVREMARELEIVLREDALLRRRRRRRGRRPPRAASRRARRAARDSRRPRRPRASPAAAARPARAPAQRSRGPDAPPARAGRRLLDARLEHGAEPVGSSWLPGERRAAARAASARPPTRRRAPRPRPARPRRASPSARATARAPRRCDRSRAGRAPAASSCVNVSALRSASEARPANASSTSASRALNGRPLRRPTPSTPCTPSLQRIGATIASVKPSYAACGTGSASSSYSLPITARPSRIAMPARPRVAPNSNADERRVEPVHGGAAQHAALARRRGSSRRRRRGAAAPARRRAAASTVSRSSSPLSTWAARSSAVCWPSRSRFSARSRPSRIASPHSAAAASSRARSPWLQARGSSRCTRQHADRPALDDDRRRCRGTRAERAQVLETAEQRLGQLRRVLDVGDRDGALLARGEVRDREVRRVVAERRDALCRPLRRRPAALPRRRRAGRSSARPERASRPPRPRP